MRIEGKYKMRNSNPTSAIIESNLHSYTSVSTWWNQNQMFLCLIRKTRPFSEIQTFSIFSWPVENGLTVACTGGQVCHEYWARPHSCDHPLPWIYSRKEQSDVCGPWWEKHPLECDFKRTVWDQKVGLPFSAKRSLLLRLREGYRSGVPSAHSRQHKKPTADVAVLSRSPQGSGGNNWLHS